MIARDLAARGVVVVAVVIEIAAASVAWCAREAMMRALVWSHPGCDPPPRNPPPNVEGALEVIRNAVSTPLW